MFIQLSLCVYRPAQVRNLMYYHKIISGEGGGRGGGGGGGGITCELHHNLTLTTTSDTNTSKPLTLCFAARKILDN